MAKGKARTFGQDLMRGEHIVGGDKMPRSLNINTQEWVQQKIAQGDIEGDMAANHSGTSIFDPVLCELAYTWFTAPGASILDPFAGGSVRGIVAAYLGKKYVGLDLRPEQVEANYEQAQSIVPDNIPVWIVGDSATDLPPGPFDFVFSCPPYADLEVYSDNPADLSTMEYPAFLDAYRAIIAGCIQRLNPNRFACFVVGDIRDKKGFYRNFVADTIQAFQDAGAMLYNEAVLITAVGSLPIRAGRQFESARKLGKSHQNVLIFCKGDPKLATAWCGPVDIGDLPDAAPNEDGVENGVENGVEIYHNASVPVKVSAKMARLPFNGCEPDYIANVCHARCCESSTHPLGIVVTIHPSEQPAIEELGGVVVDGMLQPKPGCKKCPFKQEDNLCGIHFTGKKPFGCIASPFTLNANDTLIVRNRYRLLKCYNDGNKIPAYIAFRASLDLIFGEVEAQRISHHLDQGGGDLYAYMPVASYRMLKENDTLKHTALAA